MNDVTAAGALYFSSASNSGNKDDGTSATWEGDFVDSGQTFNSGKSVGKIHTFGSSVANAGTSSQQSETSAFFWADPLGHSTNDYDMFVLDASGASLVSASTTTQNGTQDPFEGVKVNNGELIVILLSSGTGRFLHLENGRGRLAVSTAGRPRATPAPPPRSASRRFPLMASPLPSPPRPKWRPSVPTAPGACSITPTARRSRRGTSCRSGGTVRQKPDLAAADGVATAVSGFQPFYGTSAAAPHAGAIAALLEARNPGLTTSEARAALTSGVLDIEAAGTDRDSGAGLLMADLVLRRLGPTSRQPSLGSVLRRVQWARASPSPAPSSPARPQSNSTVSALPSQ